MFSTQLKASILQAAIEGKLTEQLPSDSQVDEFLKLLSKKDKKWKPINDDEIPFKIPDNWKWLRLREFSEITAGGTPSRSEPKYWNGDIPWIKIGDMKTKFINSTAESITKIGLNNSSAKIVPSGTILFSIFASIGTVGILNINAATNQAIVAINTNENINKEYMYYVLIALKNLLVRKGRGMAQMNINQEILKNTLIPIPPFEEQKRIVNKIEELLPKQELLKDDETKLMDLVTNFPEQLKASILQAAIEGKLTEQLPSDGNAIELIKEIEIEKLKLFKLGKFKKPIKVDPFNDEEIPFEIPKNWVWTKLNEITIIFNGDSINATEKETKYLNKKGIPYIATKDVGFDNIINYQNGVNIPINSDFKIAPKDSILVCIEGGSAGRKIGILNQNVFFGNKLVSINSIYLKILNKYLFFYFQSPFFLKSFKDSMKGIIGGVSINSFKNLLIPLPPFEEQRRIINKIEELSSKIRSLKV